MLVIYDLKHNRESGGKGKIKHIYDLSSLLESFLRSFSYFEQ